MISTSNQLDLAHLISIDSQRYWQIAHMSTSCRDPNVASFPSDSSFETLSIDISSWQNTKTNDMTPPSLPSTTFTMASKSSYLDFPNSSVAGDQILWVPASHHPEIAPSAFAKWIQTHEITVQHRTRKLGRQRSGLSASYTPDSQDQDQGKIGQQEEAEEDDEEDSSNPSSYDEVPHEKDDPREEEEEEEDEEDDDDTVNSPVSPRDTEEMYSPFLMTKDRHSSNSHPSGVVFAHVESVATEGIPVLPMPKSPSLSRRQAVSMKYSVHGSRSYREILQQRNDNDKAASDDRPSPISPEGVTLYDRPVSISEWVDFGNADGMKKEYEPHKLLSRLYEPESSPVESTPTEPNDGALLSITEEAETSVSLQEPLPSSASSTDSVMNEIPRDEPNIVVGRTPSKKYSRLKRSLSERLGFRSNRKTIFGSLFQDKRNKTKDTVEEPFVYRENRSMERPTHRLSHTVQGPLPRRRSSVSAFFSSRFSFRSIMRNRGSSGLQVSDGGSEEQEGPNASCYTDDGQMSVALERAMYRLSHFKLGNQRRPLRDQVLISNLMFWYLSTLNIHPYRHQPQSTSQATSASQEPHPQSSSPTTPSTSVQDNTIPTRSSTDQPGRGNSRPKSKKNIDKYKPVRNTDYVAQQRADSINTSPPQSPL